MSKRSLASTHCSEIYATNDEGTLAVGVGIVRTRACLPKEGVTGVRPSHVEADDGTAATS